MDEYGGRISRLEKGYEEMNEKLTHIDSRLKTVEQMGHDVSDILGAVTKIGKQLRVWAPAIVSAAIAAGIVNGKLGAFFHALLNGPVLG